MNRLELLRGLGRLSHDERMRGMAELGRQVADDPSVATTLDELARGDFYERYLALQACYGSRDGVHALRALGDPSRGLRTLAATLVPLLCDDAQVATALATVGRRERSLLLRQLQKRHRQAAIDDHVAQRAAVADPALDRVLPFAATPIVEQALPAVAERMERETWRRLARRHPALAAATIQRELEGANSLTPRLLWQANGVLGGLPERAPDLAFALASALVRHAALDRLDLGPLARRQPIAVVRLTLGTRDRAPTSELGTRRPDPFVRAVAHCTDDEIVTLVDRGFLTTSFHPNPWFHRLPLERRMALYLRLREGGSSHSLSDAPEALAWAPRPQREEDARRALARPGLPDEPSFELRFASVLPWDEALVYLTPSLTARRSRWRAAALAALVDTVRYSRERVPDLLALLHDRRNEQDPVRHAFLDALADLPPGLWRAEHLPLLSTLLRDALDAADQSGTSRQALERLLVRVLPFHPDWAAAELATLAQEQGGLWARDGYARLTDAQAALLAQELTPVLDAWAAGGNDEALVTLGRSLGPRLRGCVHLLGLLEAVAGQSPSAKTAETALALLRRWAPSRLAALVPTLLRADTSVITLPAVASFLHRRRQDLLGPFLQRRRYTGRFSTGRARFLPVFAVGFWRWTAAQQARYATALGALIDDPAADAPTVLGAIRRLAALPAPAPSQLLALAAEQADEHSLTVTSPRGGGAPPRQRTIARRDAALRALGRLDGGQGIEPLIEATQDERAGVAIGALQSAVLAMPPQRALALLRDIPLSRVRVGKAVVRLLGDMEDAAAYQALIELAGQSLHRDVRIALLRGLASHPERDETWAILEQAARAADPELAIAAGQMPARQLSERAQRRLLDLLLRLLERPEDEARVGVLTRCADLPVADPERRLIPPLLRLLDSSVPGEGRLAGSVLLRLYTGEDLPAIEEAVRRLLPRRRALETLVAAVRLEVSLSRRVHADAGRAVRAGLPRDPLLAELRTRLAVSALQGEELARWLEEEVDAGTFHAGAYQIALAGIGRSGEGAYGMTMAYLARMGVSLSRLRAGRRMYRFIPGTQRDGAALEQVEARLASHADERLRRLALDALMEEADDHRGWDDERLSRLRRFGEDVSALVAEPALSALADVEEEQRLLGP